MRARFLAALLALAVCSCSDEPSAPSSGPGPAVPHTWIAEIGGGGTARSLLLDVIETDGSVEGKMVVRDVSAGANAFGFVRGTFVASDLHLHLDAERSPAGLSFVLDADVTGSGGLSGTVTLPWTSGEAISGRALTRGSAPVTTTAAWAATVTAMAWDGSRVWLSTPGDDYQLMSSDTTPAGSVAVLYGGSAHWTSTALTFDGSNLWGFLPVNVGSNPGSRLIEFTTAGDIVTEVDLGHRTLGLAYDGADFWSLAVGTGTLYRLDRTGIVADSVGMENPDAYQLASDGTDLWTLGWFTGNLYRVDTAGRCLQVWELPGPDWPFGPAGLALDGTAVWTGRTDPLHGVTWVYRVGPIPPLRRPPYSTSTSFRAAVAPPASTRTK